MNSPNELLGLVIAANAGVDGTWQRVTQEESRSRPGVVGYVFSDGFRDFAVVVCGGVVVRATDVFFAEYGAAKATMWRLLYQEIDGQPRPAPRHRDAAPGGPHDHD